VNIETRLLQALADLLDVDVQQISPTMNFGDLGLDSLLGLRFARKIGELTNVETDLEWIFDYPTVRELSGFLEHQAASLVA
jgi:polyketide synthase PksN